MPLQYVPMVKICRRYAGRKRRGWKKREKQKKQKKQDGEVLVSTVLFNDSSVVIHDRKPIEKVRLMTSKDYEVYGCTALLDALGSSIHHIGNVHKYARNEDVPEHTMFVIITDGMENASCYYSKERVKSMIEYEKEKYGW